MNTLYNYVQYMHAPRLLHISYSCQISFFVPSLFMKLKKLLHEDIFYSLYGSFLLKPQIFWPKLPSIGHNFFVYQSFFDFSF